MARKTGGEAYSLERDILNSRATLVHSKDPWRVSRAADVVIRTLKEKEEYQHNFERMEASSPDIGDALERLKMLPMGGGRRILLLTGGEGMHRENVHKVRSYLENAPSTSSLVIFASGLKAGSQLMKMMSGEGRVIELAEFPRSKYPSLIREAFEEKGMKPDTMVIRYLLECLGYDLGAIHSAVEKIALCHPDKKTIELADAIELVPVSVEHKVFELVDQLAAGNLGLALKMLETMLNRAISQSAEDEMVYHVFNLVVRQFRLLLRYRSMRAQGAADREFAEASGLRYGFQLDRIKEQARSFDEFQLVAIMRELLDFDLALKSTAASPRCALELLFHEICHLREAGAETGCG